MLKRVDSQASSQAFMFLPALRDRSNAGRCNRGGDDMKPRKSFLPTCLMLPKNLKSLLMNPKLPKILFGTLNMIGKLKPLWDLIDKLLDCFGS